MNAYMQGSGTTSMLFKINTFRLHVYLGMLCTDGSVHTVDNQGSPTTPNMVQPMNTGSILIVTCLQKIGM